MRKAPNNSGNIEKEKNLGNPLDQSDDDNFIEMPDISIEMPGISMDIVPKSKLFIKRLFSKRIEPTISHVSLSLKGEMTIKNVDGNNFDYDFVKEGKKNTPVMLIKLPCNNNSLIYMQDQRINDIIRIIHESTEYDGKYYNIIITGNRKIISMIDIILYDKFLRGKRNFSKKQNEDLFNQLRTFRKICLDNQKNKTPKTSTSKSKLRNAYNLALNSNVRITSSINGAHHVTKRRNPKKEYIRKIYSDGNHLGQMESFISYLYLMVLGEPAPKAKPIYEGALPYGGQINKIKRVGVVYNKIDDFKTFDHLFEEKSNLLSPKLLSKLGIASVLAASLFFQEDDLHNNNWGLATLYDQIFLLEKDIKPNKRELYFRLENGSLEYCVIIPKNEIIKDIIRKEELENLVEAKDLSGMNELFQDETFSPEKINPYIAEILEITSKRGHTYSHVFRATRVDYDRSLWEMTAKYQGRDEKYGQPEKEIPKLPPFEAFPPLSRRDVENLCDLKDSKPYNWPYPSDRYMFSIINHIINGEQFLLDKYVTFLKCILIPQETLRELGKKIIDADQLVERAVEFLFVRQTELKKLLVTIPEFQKLIFEKKHEILHRIIQEFDIYNTQTKDKDDCLRISLEMVREHFEMMIANINNPLDSMGSIIPIERSNNKFFDSLGIDDSNNKIRLKKMTNQPFFDRDKKEDAITVCLFLQRNIEFYLEMIRSTPDFLFWARNNLHGDHFKLGELTDEFEKLISVLEKDDLSVAILTLDENHLLLEELKSNHLRHENLINQWNLDSKVKTISKKR